jgi:hypothetical protein
VFTQDGERLIPHGDRIRVNGAELMTLSLPYDRVPEHLKTILVTLIDSTDAQKTFSFLLRINGDRTAYIATVAPLGVSGDFPFRVSVFDYETTQVGYVGGVIESRIAYLGVDARGENGTESRGIFAESMRIVTSYVFWFIILLMTLLVLALRVMKRTL